MTLRTRFYCATAAALAAVLLLAGGGMAAGWHPEDGALEAELAAATSGTAAMTRRELLQLTSWVQGENNFANHDFGTVSGGTENRANGAPLLAPLRIHFIRHAGANLGARAGNTRCTGLARPREASLLIIGGRHGKQRTT